MFEFLRLHQLNIMLVMNGICGMLAILILFTKTLRPKRKQSLLFMETGAVLLLLSDRCAYLYRGNLSSFALAATRLSNFLVFFMSLFILFSFNMYLIDYCTNEGGLKRAPKRLLLAKILAYIGSVLLLLSQIFHFYYYFDEQNRYVRGPGLLLSYAIPFVMMVLQFSIIVQYYRRMSFRARFPMLLFTTFPVLATAAQIFSYGLSLTNMSIVFDAVLFYVFVIFDMNETVAQAKQHEIDLLREEQRNMNLMFVQTAEALASAIDAKDTYTHGHSARVAEYSKMIAQKAGKSEKECREVYFAALLHDVGKIGIPDSIINKETRLSDEEFQMIKRHPEIGRQILQNITQSPYISLGAHYHHERYDGKGYPDGLKGEEIPEIARIIAVADTYDAMTSNRSYRDILPQNIVRAEIEKGFGTQFDPTFATIMLILIDNDKEYQMREK